LATSFSTFLTLQDITTFIFKSKNMKSNALFFAFFATFPFWASAQLTLENVKTGRTKVLSERVQTQLIYLLPDSSQKYSFNKLGYTGIINKLVGDSIEISLTSVDWTALDFYKHRVCDIPVVNGTLANTQAMVPVKGIELIEVERVKLNGFKGMAFILTSLAVINSLAITPYIDGNSRSKIEKINLITVGVGLGVMLIPAKRRFNLGGINKDGKAVWRVKS
jgi:hypothetical protein